MESHPLKRFRDVHDRYFGTALAEVEQGRKTSHWMWFIFPQLEGLGSSDMARRYALRDLNEAGLFLRDEVLGSRLIRISGALLEIPSKTAHEIFGSPDDLKLRSSMTLFSMVPGADPVFEAVLARYFGGEKDPLTIGLLKKMPVRPAN